MLAREAREGRASHLLTACEQAVDTPAKGPQSLGSLRCSNRRDVGCDPSLLMVQ